MVTMGPHVLQTSKANYEKGMCRWNQLLSSEVLRFPLDPEQIPDIFIYLYVSGKPVCFTRVKPFQMEKVNGNKEYHFLDFNEDAKWFVLGEDKVSRVVSLGQSKG